MSHNYSSEVNQLFYTLLRNKGRLSFKENPELFKLYRNPDAIPYIKQFEEDFHCQIVAIQQETLFLQPTMENEIFSLTDKDIQAAVKGKNRTDAYLSYYACLVALNLIYLPNMTYSELQSRFTTTEAIIETLSQRLVDAVERSTQVEFLEENQTSSNPLIYEMENIERIYKHWEAKLGGGGNTVNHKKTFVSHILKFLESQDLVRLVPITMGYQAYGTDRLFAVMKVISYQDREQLVAKLLGAVDWTRHPDFNEDEQKTYDYFKFEE